VERREAEHEPGHGAHGVERARPRRVGHVRCNEVIVDLEPDEVGADAE
jgi:hypothetical protein